MTSSSWSVDQLGALADEWMAEREDFLSTLDYYLSTRLPVTDATPQRHLPAERYTAEVATIATRLHAFLRTMDDTVWYTLQQRMPEYWRQLEADFEESVGADAHWLATVLPSPDGAAAHQAMRQAIALMQHILHLYQASSERFDFASWRMSRRLVSQIKYRLYPVRRLLPAFERYWLLDDADVTTCEPPLHEIHPASGIRRYDVDRDRGAYTLYVPETYCPERAWPLILALHGGSGNDEDFLWSWLTYAKSRGYVLISAKSFGPTWYPWDTPSLLLILKEVQAQYGIDPSRLLLTGLSDGGSFGYEVGFAFPERFAGLAVIAGILRPHQRHDNACQLPVYIAHGTQDQLFPVQYTRMTAEQLRACGHAVMYHEVANFGHAYPSDENRAILNWFETTALGARPCV